MSSNKDSVYVSGPVNTIRLEGNINGNNKVLYIFMDYHEDIEKETRCKNISDITYRDFLIKNFNKIKSIDKQYNFFMEIDPFHVTNEVTRFKGKYSDSVNQFLKKTFNFDTKKDIIQNSTIYSNVKLHLIDIRSFLTLDAHETSIIMLILATELWVTRSITCENIDEIEQNLLYISHILAMLYEKLYDDECELKKDPKILDKIKKNIDNDLNEIAKNFVADKILNDYKYEIVKNKILKIINNEIKESFKKYFNIHNEILKGFQKIKKILSISYDQRVNNTLTGTNYGIPVYIIRNILNYIIDKIDHLNHCFLADISSRLMDVYFLRKYLDKNDICNSLTYTGIDHSCYIIYILIKDFGFKITDFSYLDEVTNDSSYEDKKSAINKIETNIEYKDFMIKFFPPKLYQCSNLTTFPKNFE